MSVKFWLYCFHFCLHCSRKTKCLLSNWWWSDIALNSGNIFSSFTYCKLALISLWVTAWGGDLRRHFSWTSTIPSVNCIMHFSNILASLEIRLICLPESYFRYWILVTLKILTCTEFHRKTTSVHFYKDFVLYLFFKLKKAPHDIGSLSNTSCIV